MKRALLYKFSIIAFSFLNSIRVYSQDNFIYKAALGSVKETKFYKIDLPPWLIAKCRPGLEDIRIFDEQGKQVSYILKGDPPQFNKQNISEFPVIKSIKEKDKQTHVILQNVTGKAINNLVLHIKNTDAHRAFSLSGSDDSIHWFIIKESISFDNSTNNGGEVVTQVISFPPGNYRYFQLTILGENILPFNITGAGTYNEDVAYGTYTKVPGPALYQKDSSNNKSYVWLKFSDKYQIDKLVIDVEGLKYFNRKLLVLNNNKSYDNIIFNDYLASGSANNFRLNCKGNQLLLIITNEDNMPLKVRGVEAFQLDISLFAYLQAANNYYIHFGDSTARAPIYDLQSFSDSIEKDPSLISLKGIELNKALPPPGKPAGLKNRLVLWVIIAGVLIGLCFFTFKLIKEVDTKKENN